jgi:hypothetical protein
MQGSIVATLDAPSILVDQLVVERTDEREVVERGTSTIAPPHDVMNLGESTGTAAWEGASLVPIPDLPEHPLGGLPRDRTDQERIASARLHDALQPAHASQAANRFRMDNGTVLDLARCVP